MCGTPVANDGSGTHVDHEKHFVDLLTVFAGGDQHVDELETVSREGGGAAFEPALAARWSAYHAQHAILRLVYIPCNLGRPAPMYSRSRSP